MSLHQVYAFVTDEGWQNSLFKRWPDAFLVGGYRLLAFTNEDLPKLKTEYSAAVFKELSENQTKAAINAGDVGPFICDFSKAKAISLHFNPPPPEV